MKNFIQCGDTVTLVAPYDVLSGAGALVGTLFGIASADYLSGAEGEFVAEGVFTLPAVTANTAAQGAVAYWDNSAKKITTTATSNTLVGCFMVAKTNGQTTATVRLNGVARVAEAGA